MASTVIDTRGTVDFATGEGMTVAVTSSFNSTVVMSRTPYTTVQALTASGSATFPGVYTLGNATPAGYLLPAASSVPGGVFVFRLTSAGQAHFLTASDASSGQFITDGTANGSKLTFSATAVGSSVSLISDGNKFCVFARSGSAATLAGT